MVRVKHSRANPQVVASEWDALEDRYRADDYNGRGTMDEIDETFAANSLLLTAPHSVNHARDGNVKRADRWTGSAAEIMAARLGAGTIIPVGNIADWDDWPARTDPFRKALDARAKPGTLVLDLHGMSDTHGVDLCLGLGPARGDVEVHLAAHLTEAMSAYQVAVNEPFSAEPHYTVTSYVQLYTPASAIQLEISARFRNPRDLPEQSSKFLIGLTAAIEGFDLS
jgi:hypothetical protein